jgi:hypothetical protein
MKTILAAPDLLKIEKVSFCSEFSWRGCALFQRESILRDIEEELRIHVEMETETNIARGMSPDEA